MKWSHRLAATRSIFCSPQIRQPLFLQHSTEYDVMRCLIDKLETACFLGTVFTPLFLRDRVLFLSFFHPAGYVFFFSFTLSSSVNSCSLFQRSDALSSSQSGGSRWGFLWHRTIGYMPRSVALSDTMYVFTNLRVNTPTKPST